MLNQQHQRGWATLTATLLLVTILTSATYLTSKSARVEQKAMINDYRAKQAQAAADAGLGYGIQYLSSHGSSIVVDSNRDGYIDNYNNSSLTNVTLDNGSQYSISYGSPTANNFDLVRVSSVGTSDDGQAIKTASQTIHFSPALSTTPPSGIIAKNNVDLGGNVSITNTDSDFTIWSGGAVSLSGSADTVTGSGSGSSKRGNGSDIRENDTTLSSMTNTEFFQYIFNQNKEVAKNNADLKFINSGDTNYSDSLNGQTNKIIWIDQTSGTARINSNVTIGSATNPVIVIVQGDLRVNGNATIYGVLYVDNDWQNQGGGNVEVYGTAIVNGNLSSTGTPEVVYSPDVLTNLNNQVGTWGKVAGTWRDF